ncbi:hypothetical protein ES703_13194 [subsurface metagenome]
MVQNLQAQFNHRLSSGLSFWEEQRLLLIIRQIQEVFDNYFDRTWLAIVIDGLPIDFRTIREIRLLVSLQSIHPGDERALYQSVLELEQFIGHIKRYLLPDLKERLGVSWLRPHRLIKDKQQLIIRRFVAYTFPHNLERLSELTGELKSNLRLTYPCLH